MDITYYDGTDLDVLGTNRNSQQETASTVVQPLYSDLDCLRSASDALARGFRPVIFWALKTEGEWSGIHLPPPPRNSEIQKLWPQYIKYTTFLSVLGILRKIMGIFRYFEYFFSGILVYHYPPPPLADPDKAYETCLTTNSQHCLGRRGRKQLNVFVQNICSVPKVSAMTPKRRSIFG